jgi:putative ABC transport system permease protein
MAEWLRRLWFLRRSRQFDHDLDAELRFHLDMRRRSLEQEGLSPAAADRQARHELGGPLQIREASRDVWIFRSLDQLGQDVRYALRGCRRQPAFTLAVVATLALGIGANTAIFSVVDTLLLKPAPFADASRLVVVHSARLAQSRLPLSYPNFVDLRARSRVFEGLAGWTMGEVTITGQGEPEHAQSALVTSNLFEVLGVSAALGRTFRPGEDLPGIAPVILVSHGLWTRRFARDPHVIGLRVQLDGRPYEIVGVLPEGFRFASHPHETEVWLPFGLDTFPDRKYARGMSTILSVARLRDGVSVEQAQVEVSATAAALEREYPDNNRARRMLLVPLEQQATVRVRSALVGLSVGVVVVLLVACANVVSLLLGRATARQHELAVRSVLGGSRRRIASQLLIEHLVLAMAGGAAGLLVARIAHEVLVRLPYNAPDYFTPWVASLEGATINGRVLIFTLVTSLVAGILVGVLPALQVPSLDARALSAGGSRVSTHGRTVRIRSGLVVAEIAMAVMLLTAMGLMLTAVARLLRVDPGFAPDGLTTIDLSLPASSYPAGADVVRFYDELLNRLRRTPGVTAAGAVEFLPFSGLDGDTGVLFEARQIPSPDKRPRAHFRSITSGYFEAMGIPVVAGRDFGSPDRTSGHIVAILNETAARVLFRDGRALGRRAALDFEAMRFFPDRAPIFDLELGLREIVGIVKDVRHSGLADEPMPELYVPFTQRGVRKMTLVVRSGLPAGSVIAATRQIVSALDPVQPVGTGTTMPELIAASLARPRFNTTLISAFGLLALGLSAIGIYGVMSYFVLLRTRDIGIHVAIGATRRDVFGLVTKQMAGLAAAGIIIGLAGALSAGSGLSKYLADIEPHNPVVLLAVTAVVLVTTLIATLVPAIRALRIEPARALRDS